MTLSDSKLTKNLTEIASNIYNSVTQNVLYRIDVDFKVSDLSVDTLLGKTTHLQFLQNI